MAEKLGEGRRNDDGRRTGAHDRYRRTIHGGNMTGDGRKHEYQPKLDQKKSGIGQSIQIAETVGGDLKRRANGGGRRIAPSGFGKVGGP